MAEIIGEKKKSPSGRIDFEERKKVQFFIDRVEGLSSGGLKLLPSPYYVSVENVEKGQSVPTSKGEKKGSTVSWGNNVLIPHLAESSQVRFELQQEVTSLLNKRMAVVGTTELFDICRLQDMQKQAGGGPTARIELCVNLTQQVPPSPKLPATGKRPISPTNPATTNTTEQKGPNCATLRLRVNVLDTQDSNLNLANSNKKRFAEQCRVESLEHLAGFTEKMGHLREAFDGSEFMCPIDAILGVSFGIQKALTDSNLHNENKHTLGVLEAMNAAFVPSQSLSVRKLAKTGQHGTEMMQEMLCAAIKALRSVDAFLRHPDAVVRDKLEFKLNDWIQYYQSCEKHLLDPMIADQPKVPAHRTSRRIHCPNVMVKHPELTQHNMLPMDLPQVYAEGEYERPDLVRLIAEWIFLSTGPTYSRPATPTTARTTSSVVVDANGRVNAEELGPLDNVLCLVATSGCGKTQLVAHISEWLAKTGCLGGYFSFDPSLSPSSPANDTPTTPRTTHELLEALPMTFVHQACTVEPDALPKVSAVFKQNSGALYEPLQSRFEKLFTKPFRAFADRREGARWNHLDPLVFVIDGLGTGFGEEKDQAVEDEERKVLDAFVNWMGSKGVRGLPAHIRFIVVSRPETDVAERLKEKGAVVCEMAPRSNLGGYSYGEDIVVSRNSGSSSASGLTPPSPGSKSKQRAFL